MRRCWVSVCAVALGCSSAPATVERPAARGMPSSQSEPPVATSAAHRMDFGALDLGAGGAFPVPQASPSAAFVPPAPPPTPVEPPPAAIDQRAPPYFEPLFEEHRAFHYAVVDEVDPHFLDEGRRIVSKQAIRCNVSYVRYFTGALASSFLCSPTERANDDSAEIVREMAFISAPGGIWITSSMPGSQEEVAMVLREPPQLGEVPEARTRSYQRGGAEPGEIEPCTERVEVSAMSACYEERCKPPSGYGDTRNRMCLSRGRGLESLREENLMGPRTVTWRLVRIEPPPPDEGEGPYE